MKYYVAMPVNERLVEVDGKHVKEYDYKYYNFEHVSVNFGTRTLWVDEMKDAFAFDKEEKALNVIHGDDRLKGCKVHQAP